VVDLGKLVETANDERGSGMHREVGVVQSCRACLWSRVNARCSGMENNRINCKARDPRELSY